APLATLPWSRDVNVVFRTEGLLVVAASAAPRPAPPRERDGLSTALAVPREAVLDEVEEPRVAAFVAMAAGVAAGLRAVTPRAVRAVNAGAAESPADVSMRPRTKAPSPLPI